MFLVDRSSLIVPRSSFLVAATLLSACNGDKTTTDTGSFAFGTPDCHGLTNDCAPELHVDADALRLCFGWDGPSQSWPPGTPQEILDQCPNPEIVGGDCVFAFDVETDVGCDNTCGDCIPLVADLPDTGGFPLEEIPGPDDLCCDCDVALTGLEDLTTAIDACGYVGYAPSYNCPDPEWALQTEAECDDGESFAVAPAADVMLHVDPQHSYIYLQTSFGAEAFAVAGGGTARTSVDRFMTATLWAADGTLGDQALADWVFWTTAPIDYDPANGNFTVESDGSPAFVGRGFIEGVASAAEVHLTTDATGNLSATTHTWQANYSRSVSGESIQVHLQGTWGSP